MKLRGYAELDVLIVSGDAYVDHPAFGPAVVARFLESKGFRVGIVAQPRWDTPEDLLRMGRPRLFVGVTAGNLDSMLNRLTAQKKLRSTDPYSPGGRPDQRPNRATIVYANLCRQAFPGLPLVLGGIEASLRRLAHYDYWSDSVRRSVLLDAKADLLVFGMAERPIVEIATRLQRGEPVNALHDIAGTCHVASSRAEAAKHEDVVVLPSFEEVCRDAKAFAEMTRLFQNETNPWSGRPLAQPHGEQTVYHNRPALPLEESALDAVYDLPFVRAAHPSYVDPIPALETVKGSVTIMRGCFGGCAFCSLAAHEGKAVQSRSKGNVLRELERLAELRDLRGTISDLGGPSANMYGMRCSHPAAQAACRRPSCVHPKICSNLDTNYDALLALLRDARHVPGIRRVLVASGVRYDLTEHCPEYVRELARHHTGGQLSVAPEHAVRTVLAHMRKPAIEAYERFAARFEAESTRAGKEQYLVPYFMTGHPGSTLGDTVELAVWLKAHGLRPRQVQEFIPTPMSMATAMYHTGVDPTSGEALYVARDLREKRLMKTLLFYWDEEQWPLVREALLRAGRGDLIGHGSRCLVPPGRASIAHPAGAEDRARVSKRRAPNAPTTARAASRAGRGRR